MRKNKMEDKYNEKKTFIQLHPILILLINGIFLFFVVGGIVVLIRYPLLEGLPVGTGIKKNIVLVLYPIALLYISWIGITYNHHWITFREEHIYVPSDWRIKRNRRQYRVEVKYENIVDVLFIRSTKNSKNKTNIRYGILWNLIKNKPKQCDVKIALSLYSLCPEKHRALLKDYLTQKQKNEIERLIAKKGAKRRERTNK